MDPKEIAKWAARFSKKGVRGAVNEDEPASAPAQARPSWGAPVRGSSWGGPPPELETLVKPGPSAYADIIARVPDLSPNIAAGDSMNGPVPRASEEARREALQGEFVDPGVRPDDASAPRGYRGMPSNAPIAPLADLQGKLN